MNQPPSPDTDPRIPYRYNREVLLVRACNAMFALEETLPADTEERRVLYRVRLALNDAWNNMDPVAKAAKFPAAPTQ